MTIPFNCSLASLINIVMITNDSLYIFFPRCFHKYGSSDYDGDNPDGTLEIEEILSEVTNTSFALKHATSLLIDDQVFPMTRS